MSKSRNFIHKYLFSAAGIVALLILTVAVNAVLRRASWRLDLTEDRLYSLSPGTHNILADLDRELGEGTRVTLRLYRSRGDNAMPVWLRSFAARVEDLLGEYVESGNGRVTLEVFDPTPDSDAEDAAAMDGISGQTLPNGSRFHLGLAVRCLDQSTTLPFLSPTEEAKLEYDITRAIYEATRISKPVIGLISQLPIMGGAVAPYMAMHRRPKPPWIFMQEMQRHFTVRDLGPTPTSMPEDVAVALVVHPQELAATTLYALEQFLLRGGRLIIALDPYCLTEARNHPEAMMRQTTPSSSNLPELLQAWGITFSADRVAADLDLAMRGQREDGQIESYPGVLAMRDFADSDDVVIRSMTHLNFVYAGTFSGEPASGLTMTRMLTTSRNSQMVESFMAEGPGTALLRSFAADDHLKPIALRLEGRFPALFADGPPAEPEDGGLAAQMADHLIEATDDGAVILLGDVDFLADEFCVSRQDIFGQSIVRPFNDNLALIQGLVELMSGSNDLISIRAKKIKERPFTRIMKMQAEVQDRYTTEINRLEEQREQTQMRLNELQRTRSDRQQLGLTAEQREELARYEQQMAQANVQLKDLRRELRRDIDRLQLRLQLLNIGGVPLLVVLFGIAIWGIKHLRAARRRTAS